MRRSGLSTILFLVVFAARSAEITIIPEVIKETPEFMTTVVAAEATCAAVNEAGTLLVVGCRSTEGKHLAVFRLEDGRPTGNPTWIELPKPESLAKDVTYPLGLLFHPKLPVFYVWQDAGGLPPGRPENAPDLTKYEEFDHLLTYAVKDGALELIQTGARGPGFHCGLIVGTIGLDYERKNLFVPNAQGETYQEAGIGYFVLDEEGIPGDVTETGAEKAGKAPDTLTNVSRSPNRKAIRKVLLPKKLRTNHYFPSGAGWFAGSEAMLMGGYSGCMMADFNNGALRQVWFGLPDGAGPCTLAGHPTLPAVYIARQDYLQIAAVAHANGYLTMLPQVIKVPVAHFVGLPVVMTKQSLLAVGDNKSIHLLGLREDGKFDLKDQHLKLPCAVVRGIAYSEKYGRLYVAIDKTN